MQQPKISFVIPVYDEEESVGQLHKEIVEVMRPLNILYEIIFIDDGSADNTLGELKKLSPAIVISFTRNFGKSQALQVGFDEAKGDYIITMDGDLQDDPNEIPSFIKAVKKGEGDLVCGWKQKRADPFSKRFVSKIANGVTRLLTGTNVHDMNCCFKLYKRDVAKSLRLYGDMHRYIPSIVSNMGFRITEVPVHHRARLFGKTKYGAGRLVSGMFDFITLVFLRKFIDRPMHFFGLLGFLLSFAGIVILGYLSYLKLFEEVLIGNRPLLLLGILLVVVGFQSLSLGFIGELLIRQNSDTKRNFVIKEKSIQ